MTYPTNNPESQPDDTQPLSSLIHTPPFTTNDFSLVAVEPDPIEPKAKRKRKSHAFYIPNWRLYLSVSIVSAVTVMVVGTLFLGITRLTTTADVPSVLPVPIEYQTPFPPVPTIPFSQEIGMGFRIETTEILGKIPAGSRVGISQVTEQDGHWVYLIVAQDGVTTAEARAYQLTYPSDITPGTTPTSPFDYNYDLVLIMAVGNLPAGTKVHIGSAWQNGLQWVYSVYTDDNRYAEVSDSQVAYAPWVTPGAPTPTVGL